MTKNEYTIAIRVLAIMLVENREMSLKEITEAYNETNPTEEETTISLFSKGVTNLLVDRYIRRTRKDLHYKVTLKGKAMKAMTH